MKRCPVLILNILLLVFVFSPVSGFASGDVIVWFKNGHVNWSDKTIQATGVEILPANETNANRAQQKAETAATDTAKNNLFQMIRQIDIDSGTTIGDAIDANHDIELAIKEKIRTLEPMATYLSDGSVEIRLQFVLTGDFARLVLPPEIKEIEPIKPIRSAPESSTKKDGTGTPATKTSETEPAVHTGMIVDARGLREIRPVMVPKIVDESGEEIYGPAFVSRKFAVSDGISGYTKNLAAAQSDPRVQDNPLTVKALKTDTSDGSFIVVSNSDASKLRGASEHLLFLKKCRVIIVLE